MLTHFAKWRDTGGATLYPLCEENGVIVRSDRMETLMGPGTEGTDSRVEAGGVEDCSALQKTRNPKLKHEAEIKL